MTVNEIGNEGAKTMSEMIKVNTTLKSLYLGSEKEIKKEKREDNKRKRTNNRE